MGRLDLKYIDDEVLTKIDRMAAKRNINRSEMVRKLLGDFVLDDEIRAIENKYENLAYVMVDVVETASQELAEMNMKIELLLEREIYGKKDF